MDHKATSSLSGVTVRFVACETCLLDVAEREIMIMMSEQHTAIVIVWMKERLSVR
ncbi:hypothetical protein THTE_3539 [Thermogutta terrifontis]|uniref:Uncharacterized protein n=1 Tax=Thermogutta terrifontis TaxID=1331910 RepID=A0A286RJK2_9BACT|nr:hypothetical protein THTE_3539 [Thermogutta terrifontis]